MISRVNVLPRLATLQAPPFKVDLGLLVSPDRQAVQ
jgi:hypothetical protein